MPQTMLTLESVKAAAAAISPVITRENYYEIAIRIHPRVYIDPDSIGPDILRYTLQEPEAEFDEYWRGQTVYTRDWTDLICQCVLHWQYSAAKLKKFPELRARQLRQLSRRD